MQVKELQLASLNFDIKNDYAIIQIDNGKVNAINLSLLQDLNTAFTTLSSDESVKGAILSGRPHAFSAGLDLMSLATTDAAGMVTFWEAYGQALKSMVTYDKPLVCAITGYAPAGATILTLCTDYRIMGKGEKHVIGMHEFKMQMQIPKLLCEVYAYHLGEIKAWKFIQQSRLFNSAQAVEVGLVDIQRFLQNPKVYLIRN